MTSKKETDHDGETVVNGKRYNSDGMRLTDCCGVLSTYHDADLCCKKCWHLVSVGEGDGNEYLDESRGDV